MSINDYEAFCKKAPKRVKNELIEKPPQKNSELNSKLIDDHWNYVECILKAHGEEAKAITYCGAAYKLGMELGLKQDKDLYDKIKKMFPATGELGGLKIAIHFETAFEHGLKHAQEANEQR